MRAATANGLLAIGALWGYGGNAELSGSGAALLVETPDQLLDLLSLRLGSGGLIVL